MIRTREEWENRVAGALADEIAGFCEKEIIPPERRAVPSVSTVYKGCFTEEDLLVIARSLLSRLEIVALIGDLNKW